MTQQATSGRLSSVLRRRWWVVTIGLVLGALAALLALQALPPSFTATATLLIKGVPGTGPGANLSAAQFAVARATSYPAFIHSNAVLEGVSSDEGDDVTDAELRSSLAATNRADTPLVEVTALADDPDKAEARANSAARHLARFITQIETVSGVSPVIVEIAVQAERPSEPAAPSRALVWGLGLSGGVALGAASALLLDWVLDRRTGRRQDRRSDRKGDRPTGSTGRDPRRARPRA